MSSEIVKDEEVGQNAKVPNVGPPAPEEPERALEANIPGFEYELEENVSQVSAIEMNSAVGIPRFEDNRHPHAKLIVVALALLTNGYISFRAFSSVPRQYSTVVCAMFEFDDCLTNSTFSYMQLFECFIRFYVEFVIPISVLVSFVFTQLAISVLPSLAFQFKNPVPILVPYVYFTCFFYCITNFFTSMSMLPFLGSTSHTEYWIEYLTITFYGLFWMYSLMNMVVFTQLSSFNFVRAREKFQIQQAVEDP